MRIPKTAPLLLTACAIALSAGIACSDDGVKTRPAGSGGNNSSARANTGDPQLDGTLNFVLQADTIELAGLTGYQRVGCTEAASDDGPACRDGESPGTEVEALLVTDCSASWARPEAVPDVYKRLLDDNEPKLTAVYRPNPRPSVLDAQYVAVVRTDDGDPQRGSAFAVKDGRIIAVEADCNNYPGLLAPERIASPVLEPAGETPIPSAPPQ